MQSSLRYLGLASLVPFASLFVACGPAPTPAVGKTVIEKKMAAIAELASRGTYLPPPIDGITLAAHEIDLKLPRGCVPLDAQGMLGAAKFVDDAESELLSACNIVGDSGGIDGIDGIDGKGGTGKKPVKVTVVLIRHRVQVETGEAAASALLRSPGVLSATTTTITGSANAGGGAALSPEVVVTLNAPTGDGARPGTAVWYGALDGLYVLYAEVDGDAESIAAWGDALTGAIIPGASSHPIRWRAPTGLAPSQSAFGPFKMRLPETLSKVSHDQRTFNEFIGDSRDPLDPRDGQKFATLRDETGLAVGGSGFRVAPLPGIAPDAMGVAKMSATARGGTALTTSFVDAPIGKIARVDATRPSGDHEVYAAFMEGGEVTVMHLVFAKEKWAAYSPWVDASFATVTFGGDDGPY